MSKSSGTPAIAALNRAKISFTVHAYEHDPSVQSFGAEAAAALGVAAVRIFKTLVVDTGAGLAVGVIPVAGKLDLKAIAQALGAKRCAMADPAAAERSTGMVLGGISPIGQKRALPTVLDVSMHGFQTVLVSGGRRGLDVELAPSDLQRMTRATFAAIRTG